jgi:EmrB/QacA subfamily drug resistance transporter
MADDLNAGVSKIVTLIIASISAFFGSFMQSAVNIALPTIGKELAMEAVLLGWVPNAMNLATAVLLIAAGRLADIYGRKKIFLYGMLLFTVSSFLCSIANSAISLVLYRALQGLSGGLTLGTSVAILTSVFPSEERGRAIGIYMGVLYLGLTLGPFLGGVLTEHLGWRSIFFLSTFLGLVTVGLTLGKLKGEWAEARGEKFDFVGSIAFGISLVLMMYGFTVLTTVLGIVLVVLGMLGMLAFTWWEEKEPSPVLNIRVFRKNIVFIFSNLATLINYSATFAVSILLSLYLQYNKGLSPQVAGLIMLTQPVVMTIFAPIAGRLSDRVEPRAVAATGMAFNCIALVLLTFLTDETSQVFIIASLAVFGFGMGLFSSPNTNAIMGSVEAKFFGVASGVLATMRSSGMMLSMGVMMILFSIYIGEAQITPEYYPAFLTSVKVGCIIFAALCFGGVFAQLAGRGERPK